LGPWMLAVQTEVVRIAPSSYGLPEGGEAINAFEAKGRLVMVPGTRPDEEGFHLEIKVDGEPPIHLPFCGCAHKSWTMAWVKRKPIGAPTTALIEKVFEAIKKFDDGPKGADYMEVRDEVGAKPIDVGLRFTTTDEVDEAINALMDTARVYEPILGRFKII